MTEHRSLSTIKDFLHRHFRRCPQSLLWETGTPPPFFGYSDGAEVEERLLSIVKSTYDRSVLSQELALAIEDWPSQYHLSPARANLLRPFEEFLTGKRILELGAGCGALTRFLGEIGGNVVSVEGSKARATIAAERCRELSQVNVVVDTIESFPEDLQFDVVLLIGVLEYAQVYGQSPEPVRALLEKVGRLLIPGGKLFLAIENQLGLKYFSGYGEDHLGYPFIGIEDGYPENGIVTFGGFELQQRLTSLAFSQVEVFLPFPDYKLPTTVLTPKGADGEHLDLGELLSASVQNDPQNPVMRLFSLERALGVVGRNRLMSHLANSFLMVATTADDSSSPGQPEALNEGKTTNPTAGILAYHYGATRRPEFAKEAIFFLEDNEVIVKKRRLCSPASAPAPAPLTLVLNDERLYLGTSAWWQLLTAVNRHCWSLDSLETWFTRWTHALHALIQPSFPLFPLSDACNQLIGGEYIDATPFNLIWQHHGPPVFFDLEWRLSTPVKFGFLLFRGAANSLLRLTSVAPPCEGTPLNILTLVRFLFSKLGHFLDDDSIEGYLAEEANFAFFATGKRVRYSLAGIQNTSLPVRPILSDIKRYLSHDTSTTVRTDVGPNNSPAEIHLLMEQLASSRSTLVQSETELAQLRQQNEDLKHQAKEFLERIEELDCALRAEVHRVSERDLALTAERTRLQDALHLIRRLGREMAPF